MLLEKPTNPKEIKPYCINYILSVWHPNITYKDVEQIREDLDVSMEYLKKLLRELKLTYITERDMIRLGKEKYLKEVWCKQPRETRLSIDDLSKKLNCDASSLSKMIKRLGLEEYMLTGSELSHRLNQEKRTKEKEDNERILKDLYKKYKESGKQYTLEEIYIKLKHINFSILKSELQRLRLTEMVGPYIEKCSKGKRISYYKMNKSYLQKKGNAIYLSVKFGIPSYQVNEELKELGIFKSNIDDVLSKDSGVDNSFGEFNNRLVDNSGKMSNEDLTKLLGFPNYDYKPFSF